MIYHALSLDFVKARPWEVECEYSNIVEDILLKATYYETDHNTSNNDLVPWSLWKILQRYAHTMMSME